MFIIIRCPDDGLEHTLHGDRLRVVGDAGKTCLIVDGPCHLNTESKEAWGSQLSNEIEIERVKWDDFDVRFESLWLAEYVTILGDDMGRVVLLEGVDIVDLDDEAIYTSWSELTQESNDVG